MPTISAPRASVRAASLLAMIRPRLGRRVTPKAAALAMVVRDGFYTLVTSRHANLRRLGMWLWGDDVDLQVPPLQSRAPPASRPQAPDKAPASAPDKALPPQPEASAP